MTKKKRFPLLAVTIPLFIGSLVFFWICIRREAQIGVGAFVMIGWFLVNLLILMSDAYLDRVTEENEQEKTGNVLRDVPCSFTVVRNGRTTQYESGTLTLYDKGFSFLSQDYDETGFFAYNDMGDVRIFDSRIDIYFADESNKACRISSDKPLRIRNICNLLESEGILKDYDIQSE